MDFHWVKMAVTHFVTQFTHVSRHFGLYNRKQNKKYLGKMWSQICKKIAYVSTKLLLEKSTKKKQKKRKTMKTFQIFGEFLRQN